MRLTSFSDYTLRTLMFLAVRPDSVAPARISDIAAAYAISETHLTKVVNQLAQAGDVATLRGRHGGLRLARPPAEINLGAVIRRTEPDLALVECLGPGGACCLGPACRLTGVLQRALAAFLAVLDDVTLADLVAPRRDLSRLLGLVES
ncbi:MAG: Rrf2 family transcriptional regulator [Rhodospirillales bacterium 70-18]|nr:Rrf2 family transcriptional regulator [Rhodospirillales bacterium]OJY64086.1 MAG: Rrf2 family transcriptional regulator [Rhodospirillales bacterium 70-18]